MGMGVKSKEKRLHTDSYKPGIKGLTGEPEPPKKPKIEAKRTKYANPIIRRITNFTQLL
jgi:hypothetical protein